MELTGPLRLGAVQIVHPSTREVIGYAYTVESEGGQMQYWLLHENPENSFEVLPPPEDMARLTLEEWRSRVPELWRPGSFYVRALARVYRYGETHGNTTWTTIPDASALPPPAFPEVEGGEFQLDPTGWKGALDVFEGISRGLAFSDCGLLDEANAEYWMLPAAYGRAEGGGAIAVRPGAMEAGSLQDFVELANLDWGPGCALVIIGCVNYRGERAPAYP